MLTPSEFVLQHADAVLKGDTSWCFTTVTHMVYLAFQEADRRMNETLDKAAKKVCELCNEGRPIFVSDEGDEYHELWAINPSTDRPYWQFCEAEPIRKLKTGRRP